MANKLSDQDRQKLIDQLTTNCDVEIANIYGPDDVETLKAMDDVKLFKLAATKQSLIDNAADPEEDDTAEDDEAPADDVADEGAAEEPTGNMGKGKGKKKIIPPAEEDEEDEKDSVVRCGWMETNSAKPVKTMTEAEWLQAAPAKIRSVVQNALRREAQEKQELIENMVANVAEEDQAQLTKTLNAKSIEELQVLAKLRPSQVTNSDPNPSYLGQGIPHVRNNAGKVKRDEPLIPPTINWSEKE